MLRNLAILLMTLSLALIAPGCKSQKKGGRVSTVTPQATANAPSTSTRKEPPTLPAGAKAGPLDLSKIGPHDKTYAHESLGADEWAEVALMYQAKGQNGQALSTLNNALARYPGSAHLYAIRGALWLQLREYAKAVADLKKSLDLQEDPGVRVNYAEALRKFGRKQDALKNLDQALSEKPGFFPALFNRGVLRYQTGDKKGAIDDFSEAIKIDPKAAAPYFNRASILWQEGRKEAAIRDMAKFVELAPVGSWKDTGKTLLSTWREQVKDN